MADSISYGIDFGTSTLLLCADEGGLPRVISLSGLAGRPWVESAFAHVDGQWFVGDEARRVAAESVFSLKARITAFEDDDARNLEREFLDAVKALFVFFADSVMRLENIDLKRSEVRIAVPVMWSRSKRELLISAAKAAGYTKLMLTNVLEEPIAALSAWLRTRAMWDKELALVFDCGGGTTDVAVLSMARHEGESRLAVTATKGIPLGGDFADLIIAESLLTTLQVQVPEDDQVNELVGLVAGSVRANRAYPDVPTGLQPLYRAAMLRARQVKEGSGVRDVQEVSFAPEFPRLPKISVTSKDLNLALEPLIANLVRFAEGAVRESAWRMTKEIDDQGDPFSANIERFRMADPAEILDKVESIYLVGGMAHLPGFLSSFRARFSKAEVKVASQPQQAIVEGLAPEPPYLGFAIANPGVDVVITTPHGEQLCCYEMFTPLHRVGDIHVANNHAGVSRTVVVDGAIQEGLVGLRLPSGKLIPILVPHAPGESSQLTVSVGGGTHKAVTCKVYADGRIFIRDAAGKRHFIPLPWWPSAIGDFSAKVHNQKIEPLPLQPHRHK